LLITSQEELESQQETRVYPAKDVLRFYPANAAEPANADFDMLIEFTTLFVDADSWDEVGGAGQIRAVPIPMSFVIQQTPARFRRIDQMFETLRRQKQQRARGKLKVSDWTIVGSERERELFRLMRLPTPSLQAWPAQMTVRELTKRVRAELKLPFLVQTRALEEIGLDESHVLKLPAQRRTLSQVLSTLPKELGWTLDQDAVVVREVDSTYLVGVYPLDEVKLTLFFDDALVETIDPGGWSDDGGKGEYQFDDLSLFVLQRPAQLDRVPGVVRRFRYENQPEAAARPSIREQRTKTPKHPASAYRQGTFF